MKTGYGTDCIEMLPPHGKSQSVLIPSEVEMDMDPASSIPTDLSAILRGRTQRGSDKDGRKNDEK